MSRIFVTLAFIVASYGVAAAQSEECRAIETDLDRLACYDAESGRTPTVIIEENNSNWDVRIKTSEMTDEKTVVLSVDADEPIACGLLSRSSTPTLIVRCSENTTAIYISTACHLTSSSYDTYGDVTYRLDDNTSKTKRFSDSTNNKALGLWRGGSSIPFIKAMFGHDSMLTRFTPYSENAVTPRFQISGIEDVILPLREACHW